MYVMDDPTQRRSGEHIAIFNACNADIYVPIKKITQGTTLCEITVLHPNTKKNIGANSFEFNQSYIPLGASDADYGAFLQCEREMTYVENYKCNEDLLACWARY